MDLKELKDGHRYRLTLDDGTVEPCTVDSHESEADSPEGIECVFVEFDNRFQGHWVELSYKEVIAAEEIL